MLAKGAARLRHRWWQTALRGGCRYCPAPGHALAPQVPNLLCLCSGLSRDLPQAVHSGRILHTGEEQVSPPSVLLLHSDLQAGAHAVCLRRHLMLRAAMLPGSGTTGGTAQPARYTHEAGCQHRTLRHSQQRYLCWPPGPSLHWVCPPQHSCSAWARRCSGSQVGCRAEQLVPSVVAVPGAFVWTPLPCLPTPRHCSSWARASWL